MDKLTIDIDGTMKICRALTPQPYEYYLMDGRKYQSIDFFTQTVPALCALAREQQAEIERLHELAHRIATFKGNNPAWTAGDFEYLVELAGKMEGGTP